MGSIYPKQGKLWIAFKDVDGKRRNRPTDFKPGEESQARRVLAHVEGEVKRGVRIASGTPTVAAYAERFHVERKERGLWGDRDDRQRFRDYVLPSFGSMRLDAVRPKMVEAWALKLRPELAPRTLINLKGLLHRFFEDARADELLDINPVMLKRGVMPKKKDKDPLWRKTALYSLAEIGMLVSDDRVPMDARVIYALSLFCGLRPGEIAPRTWADYDASVQPLGCLFVHSSYRRQNKVVKSTKTEAPREVPVHPMLAELLAEWRTEWTSFFGHAPGTEDLIAPNRHGGLINDLTTRDMRLRDFKALGLRKRRLHDARRTFTSAGQEAGANREVLESITHRSAASKDQQAGYTSFTWAAKCEAVMLLPFRRLVPRPALRAVGAATALLNDDSEGQPTMTTATSTLAQGEIRTRTAKRPYRSPGVISLYSEPRNSHRGTSRDAPSSKVAAENALEALDAGEPRSLVRRRLAALVDQLRGGR